MKKQVHDLIKQRKQQIEQHKCDVSEHDYIKIQPKIDMIKRLAEIEGSIYAVYDLNKNRYLLQSEEQKRLFGYSNKNESENMGADSHYDNFHPDDLPFILESDNMVYNFYSNLNPEEKKDYRLVYNFRIKNTEGLYKHYMHQSIVLELDRKGKSWLSLIISYILPDNKCTLQRRLIHIKTGKHYLFNKHESDNNIELSKRESEILKLIGYGYDSINIADKLNISINTVNNHRQNILRKSDTENTTQAVMYYKRIGLI